MPAGNVCLFLEMKILISNMLESTRTGKNIQEKDLGEWNGAFLDFKGAVLLHPVRGDQLCFSPGHVLLLACEWQSFEQGFCNLCLLNTGFVLLV